MQDCGWPPSPNRHNLRRPTAAAAYRALELSQLLLELAIALQPPLQLDVRAQHLLHVVRVQRRDLAEGLTGRKKKAAVSEREERRWCREERHCCCREERHCCREERNRQRFQRSKGTGVETKKACPSVWRSRRKTPFYRPKNPRPSLRSYLRLHRD